MSAALLQAAQAALARRDFAAARQAAAQVLRDRPSDAGANQILGLVALEDGDAVNARIYLQKADRAAPGQPHILNALGIALRRSGDVAEARRAFARAGERGLIDGWRNLGNLEALAGDAVATAKAYERALKSNASDVASLAGLGQAKELLHDLASARALAEAALAIDASSEIATLTLAQIAAREHVWAEAEAAAMRVARNGKSPTNRALAWGVIGDVRDKQNDAASAFSAFEDSNRLLLALYAAHLGETHLPYHPAGVERMMAFVEATDFSAWDASDESSAPVFLVGFPRSGTTLLEQVLSAHSHLVCIEEREHLALAAGEVAADPVQLAALDEGHIGAIRDAYWKRVRAEANVGRRIVVDKLPLNIIFLPLIRRVFPNTKILFALRDPRDVVLSCFQQRFGMNAAMVQFLQLETAAAYYDKVMSLGSLCREKLGLSVLEVRYENVVADLEAVARSVTDFLGLPFEEAMLSPSETAKARNINTPSARQVIEPIYSRSVARWKRYETQLAPVLPVLNRWADRFGY
jgi:Tfp pilus assembly protein PilF